MGKLFKINQYLRKEDNNFPFHIGHVTLDNEDFDSHGHDYSEIVFITGGEGRHTTDFGVYPLRAGDVYLIHPHYSHGFRECRHLSMFNISYESRYAGTLDLGGLSGYQALFNLEPLYRKQHNFTSRLHLKPEQRSAVLGECRLMEREFHERRAGYRTICFGRLQSLMGELCRYYEENMGQNGGHRDDLMKLGSALAVLEQRFTEDLTIEELARLAGYSVNHFSRLCKKVYGVTPRQYILQQRLSLASGLLRESDLSITEVSGCCGFDDSNYFSRLFKQKMGVTPREYQGKG